MPAIRFRTQDTRASWARKLNNLLAPALPAFEAQPARFEETPATLEQWARELDQAVADLTTAGYVFDGTIRFRLSDTRQMWARKLNVLSGVVEADIQFTVTVVASPTSIAGDGVTTSTLTATVERANGTPVEGAVVTWSTTSGTLAAGTTTSDVNGESTKVLTSDVAPGTATVTASTAGGSGEAVVTFT